VIEPGELLVRLTIEAAEGTDGQEQALQAFEAAHGAAVKTFRRDLSAQLPEVGRLEFGPAAIPATAPGWCWAAGHAARWRPAR
jgi:hypothetical protein